MDLVLRFIAHAVDAPQNADGKRKATGEDKEHDDFPGTSAGGRGLRWAGNGLCKQAGGGCRQEKEAFHSPIVPAAVGCFLESWGET